MKEHNSTEVILHDIDPTAVDLLIEYAYTGEITITPDNVQVLLPASSLLQMQEVREACCRFLMRQLDPTNCLGIRSFAGKFIECLMRAKLIFFFVNRYALLQRTPFKISLFCFAELLSSRWYRRISFTTL